MVKPKPWAFAGAERISMGGKPERMGCTRTLPEKGTATGKTPDHIPFLS
jgi:hypothetical protein